MIWALCVVPLLRVLPILVPKVQISFFPFLNQARLWAPFLVQLKGILRIGLGCSREPYTKPLRSFSFLEVKIHTFKLTKQQPVPLKVSFK